MNAEDEYESIGENNDCEIFKRTQFSEDGIAEDYVNIPKSFILYILENNQTKKYGNRKKVLASFTVGEQKNHITE